jgi:hypothetical protein
MVLIDKYFSGKVIYLESFVHENDSVLFNICNPDPIKRIGQLHFSEIEEFSDTQYDTEEKNYLESVIDIIEEGEKVLFVTDLREITFTYKTIDFRNP